MSEPSGFVYVLRCHTRHKIGHSRRPRRRRSSLQRQAPWPVELVCQMWATDRAETERHLHTRYAGRRVWGEWFELSEADLAELREMAASMPAPAGVGVMLADARVLRAVTGSPGLSDKALASRLGVSPDTVGIARASLAEGGLVTLPAFRVGRDGRHYRA